MMKLVALATAVAAKVDLSASVNDLAFIDSLNAIPGAAAAPPQGGVALPSPSCLHFTHLLPLHPPQATGRRA